MENEKNKDFEDFFTFKQDISYDFFDIFASLDTAINKLQSKELPPEEAATERQRINTLLDVTRSIMKYGNGIMTIGYVLKLVNETTGEALTKAHKKSKHKKVPLEELLNSISFSEMLDIIVANEEKPAEERAILVLDKAFEYSAKGSFPTIPAKQAFETITYPVDKVNDKLWSVSEGGLYEFGTAKNGTGKDAFVTVNIDFEELEECGELSLNKKLTNYDKRVYTALAAIVESLPVGNKFTTASQIYFAMGNKIGKRPNATQLQKINDSLTKLSRTTVEIDNKSESETYRNMQRFKYDGQLLPMERVSAYVGSQFTDSAIHVLREPPLITFAKSRKQITTIPKELLMSPIKQTEDNLALEDYLITRISRMKNSIASNKKPLTTKILYSTIFKNTDTIKKASRDEPRTKEKIHTLLNFYKEQGFIKNYKIGEDGVTIIP